MNELAVTKLVKAEQINFGTLICDVYTDNKGNFFVTREQIGRALEYADPQKAIDNLHERHKERLDKFSIPLKLRGIHRDYETIVYSAKGIYEICRWSKQPKANDFYDFVYDILEGLKLGYLKLTIEKQTSQWIETRYQGKLTRRTETDTIQKLTEYAKEQGSAHADKLYIVYSKLANKTAGIQSRDAASTLQLNNLLTIENIILNVIKEGIKSNKGYKQIYNDCKERLENFKEIAYLAG